MLRGGRYCGALSIGGRWLKEGGGGVMVDQYVFLNIYAVITLRLVASNIGQRAGIASPAQDMPRNGGRSDIMPPPTSALRASPLPF